MRQLVFSQAWMGPAKALLFFGIPVQDREARRVTKVTWALGLCDMQRVILGHPAAATGQALVGDEGEVQVGEVIPRAGMCHTVVVPAGMSSA